MVLTLTAWGWKSYSESMCKTGIMISKLAALWIFLAFFTLPAIAGELVIRETETEIIVEYTGEPENKQTEKNPQDGPVVENSQPDNKTTDGTSAKKPADRTTRMIERAEVRRKAKMKGSEEE